METNNIATELDRAFAAARRNALMSSVKIGDIVDPLSAIHKALKAKHTSGELTDEQYTEKARELLGWSAACLGEIKRPSTSTHPLRPPPSPPPHSPTAPPHPPPPPPPLPLNYPPLLGVVVSSFSLTVRDRASDMTTELDSVAADAPDNAEGATVRTARYAINAAHASGNITGEHAQRHSVNF